MATKRTAGSRKTSAAKLAGGDAKAKVKRVAGRARTMLEGAAHDAGLALRRTASNLKTKVDEAKGPAKRTARRVERRVSAALESASESIAIAGSRAKARFDAARRAITDVSLAEARAAKSVSKKPVTTKPAASPPSAKRPAAKKAPVRRRSAS